MRRALKVALFAAALLPLGARAQTITAAPGGNMTSLVGMPFDVPFYVDMTARPEKVGAFAARVQWNPAVLQLNGGSDGTFGAVTVNEDSLPLGVARIAGANPAGVGGLITLGILHFTPLVAQSDTIHFSVTELFAAGTFAALTPVTTRDGYFCPARGMFGDIDKDGAINSRDALIALSNAVGLDVSAFDITLGDVDGNGVTNARDALIILSYAVGLPVTGFRVGRLEGGACASNLPVVMAIVPDTVDLVVGQTVALEARAADSTGVLQTVTNVIWKSANTAALVIAPDGTALAHDTGTVWVTAIRTALDSAQGVVHIALHRTRDIVDATAANARNQLGSAAFPFAQIGQGIAFAQGGDTVEVRSGRYAESVQLDRAAVLIGDTLPDGTRPLIAAGSDANFGGITLSGTGARIVRDLAIDGFEAGVDEEGPGAVLLHGLRVTNAVYGAVAGTSLGSFRLESSRLVGTGTASVGECYDCSDGLYFDTTTPVDTLVVQDVEISDFSGNGVYAPGADSLAVLRSRIHDVGEYGIEAGPNAHNGCDEECAAPRRIAGRASVMLGPSVGFAMDSSAVLNANYTGVYLDGIRSAAFSHSVLNNYGYAIEVYGLPGGWAKFEGDSVVQPASESDWLYAESLDSLTMDSVFAQAYYGEASVYTVPLVRVTNSQFTGTSGTALYVGGSSGYGVVTLDNVSVTGDPSCDVCMDGLSFSGERVTANRLSMTNLNEAVYAYGSDSSMTVTNSLMHHVYYGIEWSGSQTDSTSRLTVDGTTFLGFYQAIEAEDGGLRVDNSTFRNGTSEGIYFDGSGPVRVAGNSFASVQYPIEIYPYSTYGPWVDTVSANTITDLSYEGIEIDADDSVPFRIVGNSVTCNTAGQIDGYAFDLEYSRFFVSGNQVSGCYQGIEVYDDGVARPDSIVGNTLALPTTFNGGIYVEGYVKARVANNSIVVADTAGSSEYGAIYVDGYGSGSTAVIDSNTVTGGNYYGIFFSDLDTALVRANSVQGVRGTGIVADGFLAYLAQIYGNRVSGTYGYGMVIYNNDSAMVAVDSNLVQSSTADGIQLEGGADSVTRNGILNNRIGVEFTNYPNVDQTRTLVAENNIVGNGFGVLQVLDAYYQATNNWWGDPKGPRCPSLTPCGDSSTVGDSVSAGGVNFTPFATSAFGNTPAPAAPARALMALRSPAGAHAVKAPAPKGLDAPVAKKARTTLTAPALVARAARPRAAATAAVPRVSGARAPAWAQRAQLRTAALARSTQHRAAVTAALAQVAAGQAALEQRAAQRQALREAKLKVKQARQAAARAALPRAPGAQR